MAKLLHGMKGPNESIITSLNKNKQLLIAVASTKWGITGKRRQLKIMRQIISG